MRDDRAAARTILAPLWQPAEASPARGAAYLLLGRWLTGKPQSKAGPESMVAAEPAPTEDKDVPPSEKSDVSAST